MFHYEGLPDTMPKEMLEYYLLNNGTCFVTKVDGKLYAFCGSFGGEPDPYYRPTRYIVANPALNLGKDYDFQTEGVLVRNDPLWVGLYPLMCRYAYLMAENMLTLRTADIMLRIMALLSAPDDRTKTAADAYLQDLEKGKLGVIAENRFFDEGIKMQSPPSNNGSYLTQFIELHQYLTGTFYNEIGLNANFNMKRESIGEGESSLNEDSLLPLVDEMLMCRKEDMSKINKMFGTTITVEFDSAWLNNRKQIELSMKQLAAEASQLAEGSESNGEGKDASQSTDDSADGAVTESGSGVERNTNEDNGTPDDESTDRGGAAEQTTGDEGIDDSTGSDSERTGEVVLEVVIVGDHEKKEDENSD
jgi:hypothetical protein